MSEGRKPLSRWLLLGELVGGIAFGLAVAAYCWGVPPTVNLGMSIPAVVVVQTLFFALVMAVFNVGLRDRSPLVLVGAAILFLVLIVFSFPQY